MNSDFETVETAAAEVSEVAKIVGNYSNQVFRETCHLIFPTRDGKQGQCSATWMGGTRLITAAHCELTDVGTTASCFCGVDRWSKKDVFTTVKIKMGSQPHPKYSKEQFGYDARVAYLENEPTCPAQFSKIEPAVFAPSLAEAKKLLAAGDCYFSGFGRNNSQNTVYVTPASTDALHSVETPTAYTFSNQRGSEAVEYTSVGKLSAILPIKRAEIDKFVADQKLTPQKAKALKKQLNAQLDQNFANELKKVQKDKNGINGVDHGDSGGSLICLGTGKNPKHYLVGIPVTIFQTATLVNDPVIWNWLKKYP